MRRCRPALAHGFSTRWCFRGLAGRVIVFRILFTLDGQRTVFNEKEADGGGRGGPRLYLPLSPLPARARRPALRFRFIVAGIIPAVPLHVRRQFRRLNYPCAVFSSSNGGLNLGCGSSSGAFP